MHIYNGGFSKPQQYLSKTKTRKLNLLRMHRWIILCPNFFSKVHNLWPVELTHICITVHTCAKFGWNPFNGSQVTVTTKIIFKQKSHALTCILWTQNVTSSFVYNILFLWQVWLKSLQWFTSSCDTKTAMTDGRTIRKHNASGLRLRRHNKRVYNCLCSLHFGRALSISKHNKL